MIFSVPPIIQNNLLMHWEIIKNAEIESWNEKLKQTTATLFQYPFYLSGKYDSLLYDKFFLKYVNTDKKELAFVAVIEFGIVPFKTVIIDDGPVILDEEADALTILDDLIKLFKRKSYLYVQIQPLTKAFESLLNKDSEFKKEVYYPFHKKEEAEWNIYNQPEEKLLAGFKVQGRRKIVLAGRVAFEFCKLKSESHLKDVENLFKQVEKTKRRTYIPFSAILKIYKNGKKHNLCEVYCVYLNNKIVNAVFIIKDAQCFYHFTSAMLVKGYHQNESPPAKLHLYIMKDCFYNEHKNYYNISSGGTHNLIRFKELFNPVEVTKPPYYTRILQKNYFSFFKKILPKTQKVWAQVSDLAGYVFFLCTIIFASV